MDFTFNNRIKQILLLAALILLIGVSIKELSYCMPGLLGAVTLYILGRGSYFQMVYNRKWKKGRAAGLFLLYYMVLLAIPIYFAVTLISPKINQLLSDPNSTIESVKQAFMQVQAKTGIELTTPEALSKSLDKITAFIPSFLNSTANLLTNLIIMLFFLYHMLYHGSEMEKTLFQIIPLKKTNTTLLVAETKKMVRANALSIPLISIIQGLTATLGYFIFGVQEWALWGFLTGVFAFFPVVGTMIIWIPLVIYTYTLGHANMAIALTVYNLLVTGNVDYISRISIMKKMGNVHPVITVLGVLIGLGLFGFIGLIFGPLLISYIVLLFKIYMNEFVELPQEEMEKVDTNNTATPTG